MKEFLHIRDTSTPASIKSIFDTRQILDNENFRLSTLRFRLALLNMLLQERISYALFIHKNLSRITSDHINVTSLRLAP